MLSPGEIAVGMNITVLNAKPMPTQVFRDSDGDVSMQLTPTFDCMKGFVLKVVAVQLPFVVVDALGFQDSNDRYSLDTRIVTFMELDESYVKAMTPIAIPEKNTTDVSLAQAIQSTEKQKKHVCPKE